MPTDQIWELLNKSINKEEGELVMKIRIDLYISLDIQLKKDACLKQENGCRNFGSHKVVIITDNRSGLSL